MPRFHLLTRQALGAASQAGLSGVDPVMPGRVPASSPCRHNVCLWGKTVLQFPNYWVLHQF